MAILTTALLSIACYNLICFGSLLTWFPPLPLFLLSCCGVCVWTGSSWDKIRPMIPHPHPEDPEAQSTSPRSSFHLSSITKFSLRPRTPSYLDHPNRSSTLRSADYNNRLTSKMATELAFAKTFLSLLDSKPPKISPDHVEDPRSYPSITPVCYPPPSPSSPPLATQLTL